MVESYAIKPHQRLNGKLTLPFLDMNLKKELSKENASIVIDRFSLVNGLHKIIEQAGSTYEKLKVRVHKQILREEKKSF